MRGRIIINQSSEPDENNLLNGLGIKNQLPSFKKRSTNPFNCQQHLQKNSLIYFILTGLLIVVIGSIFLDPDLPSPQYSKTQMIEKNPTQQNKEDIHKFNRAENEENPQKKTVLAQNFEKQHLLLKEKKEENESNINPELKSNHTEVQVKAPEKTETQLSSADVQQIVKEAKEKHQPKVVDMNPGNPPAPKKSQISSTSKRPVAGVTVEQRNLAIELLQLKNQDLSTFTPLAQQEFRYYQNKYNISQYEELPFCIVIPSYNNVKDNLHIKNIRSVIMQNYTNYHVVFIDDASTDRTGEEVQDYLEHNQTLLPSSRYIVIKNQVQQRAMPNLRKAAKELCLPNQIFLIADGDDELLGRQVLKLFNAIFHRDQAWFVYSNFLSIRNSVGYSRPFPTVTKKNNKYRSYPFVTSHLRAFYTQLFLNIKEEDLKDNQGHYLKAANDVAICIPILEMSHEKVTYLPELTYFYNSNTGQNNHKLRLKEQKGNDKMLRKRPRYQPLQVLFPQKSPDDSGLESAPQQINQPFISYKLEVPKSDAQASGTSS